MNFRLEESPAYDLPKLDEKKLQLIEQAGYPIRKNMFLLRKFLTDRLYFDGCASHEERTDMYDEMNEDFGRSVGFELTYNNKLRGNRILGIRMIAGESSQLLRDCGFSSEADIVEESYSQIVQAFAGRNYNDISEDEEALRTFIHAFDQAVLTYLSAFAE